MRKNNLSLNNLFERSLFNESFFNDMDFNAIIPSMRTDIKASDKEYTILIDVPGVSKEDISIDLEDGYLYITAKVEKEAKNDSETWIRRERYSSSQSQKIYVGDIKEETINASMKDGVLTIVIPKEPEKEPVKKSIIIN